METAFDEGYTAFCSGLRLIFNPYTRGTKDHAEWENGWYYGQSMAE